MATFNKLEEAHVQLVTDKTLQWYLCAVYGLLDKDKHLGHS